MLGHKWESAEATILNLRTHPGSGHSGGHGSAADPEQHYGVEVHLADGSVIRGLVIDKSQFVHPIGAKVTVEVNTKTHELRLDSRSHADASNGVVNMAQQIQDIGSAGSGTSASFTVSVAEGMPRAGGLPGLAGVAGAEGIAHLFDAVIASQSGGASVHVVGPDGQDIPVAMRDGEVGDLAQAILSGDPAAKQAAMQRIRQIKDQAQQHAPGGLGQPGGFDQPGGFTQPEYNQPGGFIQPDFNPPPAPAPFGSFDTGAGQGTKHEQLARLQQLLDKGILTESEFEAQRQQLLGDT
jgi:hypothetical protein